MADRRPVIIPLLILAFIFLSPDLQRPPAAGRLEERPRVEDVIAEEQRSLDVLRNSSYGDLNNSFGSALNLTGLEPERGYAWDALPKIKDRAREQLEHALGSGGKKALESGDTGSDLPPLYHNVTGHVRGKWTRSKIQENLARPQLNISTYAPEGPFGTQLPRSFGRNITGDDGDVRIRFHEKQPEDGIAINATNIRAEMVLQESLTGDEHQLEVHGVYFTDIGEVIMTTTSEKLAGVYMLPQLALSEWTFERSKLVMNQSIANSIQRHENGGPFNDWSSRADGTDALPFTSPQCELVVYLQQLPPIGTTSAYTSTVLSFLERELRFPTGAYLPMVPELRFSMLAFSPDCGYVLESKGPPDDFASGTNHLAGPKIEMLYTTGRHHLLVLTAVLGAQIFLLMRQMREASTPSTRSRISFYTVVMLSLGDGFTYISLLLISLAIAGIWVVLMSTTFLAFISVSFFGMRFMMDIWAGQAPERAARAREEAEEGRQRQERFEAALTRIRAERQAAIAAALPPSEQPATEATPTSETTAPPPQEDMIPGSLPLPVTAQRPTDTGATPVFMPSDQEGLEPIGQAVTGNQITNEVQSPMANFGSLYARFYLVLLAVIFVSSAAASWPSGARRVYFTLLGFLYLSFWVPQILRNVQRNCRHALNWEFVLGQSVLRLVPFGYFYTYKHNVLFVDRDYTSLALLTTWLWIQILVLGSQELVGPRWFIRKDWAPPAYDYHPVLREDEEGATMPIGFSEATAGSAPTSPLLERQNSLDSPVARRASIAKETKEKGKRIFDCAICMQDLEVPVVEAGGSSEATLGGGLLSRRAYMVTPCRHIFHSACLEGWMKYRLQCPICRETLPPM